MIDFLLNLNKFVQLLIGIPFLLLGFYPIKIKYKALYLVGVGKLNDLSPKDDFMKISNWIIIYTFIFSLIALGIVFILLGLSLLDIK